jgi:hypothetical protein
MAVPTFSDDHPVLTAQQLIYNVIDTEKATFGVYQNNAVRGMDALADIRAVFARILSYANHDDLKTVIPADLETFSRRTPADMRLSQVAVPPLPRYLSGATSTFDAMRIRKYVGALSGLLVTARRPIREHGGDPSTSRIDEQLDERDTATDG